MNILPYTISQDSIYCILRIGDGSKCTRTQSTHTHEYFLEYSVLLLEYFLQNAISTHTSTRVL